MNETKTQSTMDKQAAYRANKKANFEPFPTSALLDMTAHFCNLVEAGRHTHATLVKHEVVLEILKERGI